MKDKIFVTLTYLVENIVPDSISATNIENSDLNFSYFSNVEV